MSWIHTHIESRPYVLYQWLAILKRVHTMYHDDPKLPSANTNSFQERFEKCFLSITKCNKRIMDYSVPVTDASVINAENI